MRSQVRRSKYWHRFNIFYSIGRYFIHGGPLLYSTISTLAQAVMYQSCFVTCYMHYTLNCLFKNIMLYYLRSYSRFMSILWFFQSKEEIFFVKGAPEVILQQCTKYSWKGQSQSLNTKKEQEFLAEAHEIGRKGLRGRSKLWRLLDQLG